MQGNQDHEEAGKYGEIKRQLLDAYQFRHAVKDFDPAYKIAPEDFEFILEAGRLSPSSYGFEPWKFVVVQSPGLRDRIAPHAGGARRQLASASHAILVLARLPRDMVADSDYISHMLSEVQKLPPEIAQAKRATYDAFLRTGFALQGNERAMFEWACRQTYLALGNMMTAAAAIGIDSCPMEGFVKHELERVLTEEGALDAEHFGLACMAAFGRRAGEAPPKTRREKSEVVEWR
ncbi:NAD(P)H-dependent oxidoreductase [Saccharibacillus sp. CPCC 101409]|uniref:NAD(P)H-dependent oxidoreductase n=1 Tax=Saccharibacillus sp. CPCC 101409 TaxID=3058041 RepID=UPI00267299D4|nr:NAD(P)H-dependent oxidoreductase [Saccharibacillus sp. CPCC 101409]MDO3409990.1 NAD(P)H-dependent oxidoreductase [Saccharibacillus sp. CPCC 101409]